MANNDIITKPSGLQLCSRCINHEINSWINENWKEFNEDTKKAIYMELKSISLRLGKCIVCNNTLVSKGTSAKIFKILKENKISPRATKEFKQYFVS